MLYLLLRHIVGIVAELALRRILVPTDFSSDVDRALEYACELARKFGGEIVLIHVDQLLTPIAIGPAPGAGYDPSALQAVSKVAEEQRKIAERELEKIAERLRAEGFKARYLLKTGSPFVEIVTAAQHESADLIVISTHGRTGLAHVLMGSVAEKVVRKAPCPVLTVRNPERKFRHPLEE